MTLNAAVTLLLAPESIEAMAAALHAYWVEEYRKAGFTSRLSSWGDEFMLPWAELSDRCKDFDRRGILAAIQGGLVQNK